MDRIGALLRPEKSCVPDFVDRPRKLAVELKISGPNLNMLKNSYLGQLGVTIRVLVGSLMVPCSSRRMFSPEHTTGKKLRGGKSSAGGGCSL